MTKIMLGVGLCMLVTGIGSLIINPPHPVASIIIGIMVLSIYRFIGDDING